MADQKGDLKTVASGTDVAPRNAAMLVCSVDFAGVRLALAVGFSSFSETLLAGYT